MNDRYSNEAARAAGPDVDTEGEADFLRKVLAAFVEDARARIGAVPSDVIAMSYCPGEGFSLSLETRGRTAWIHNREIGSPAHDPSDAVDNFVERCRVAVDIGELRFTPKGARTP